MGEQLDAVKAMTGVLHPWEPSFEYQTWNHIDNSLGRYDQIREACNAIGHECPGLVRIIH